VDQVESFLADWGHRADEVATRELMGALAARDDDDAHYWAEMRAGLQSLRERDLYRRAS
jgi:hypothetical protein